MTYITATAPHAMRVLAASSDVAVAKAVDQAGREGLDIFDVVSARKVTGGSTDIEFVDGEFRHLVEYIVRIRIITGTELES